MPVELVCTACAARLRVPGFTPGRAVRCPKCATVFVPAAPPPEPKKLLQNPDFLWTVGLLCAVMLGGALAIGLLDRWRRRQVDPARWKKSGPELNSFREMLDAGEITHSEYQRIRDKVATKMRSDAGLKKPAPPTLPESPAPGVEKT
jgi:hypothetical protein